MKIAIDCANGAGYKAAPQLLKELGAKVISIGVSPNGFNINEVIELILDMFEDVMKAGPLAKEPCVNMKITLMDCKLHEDAIHRGPSQMDPAVRDGIRGAVMGAGPVLYEPLQLTRIEAPDA